MTSLTTQILIDIRDEIRGTNTRLEGTNERLDRTNERLDRVVEEQIRHATAIVAVEVGQRRMEERLNETIHGVTRAVEGLHARIDNVLVGGVGQTVREHESRLQRVEERLGLTPFDK
jgi:hypothetical protein